MKTKNILSFTLICSVVLMASCTKQPYYDVPLNPDGTALITQVSTATSKGVSTLDDQFTIDVTLPNAKEGDVMKVEVLKLQTPPNGGDAQLLPLAGTQKDATVGSDLKTSITYTRAEAMLNAPGDYVTVTFAGETDAASLRVDMAAATTLTGPEYNGTAVNVTRGAGTAFYDLEVTPKQGDYTGQVIVKRKNGTNAPWVNVGTGGFTSPAQIPIASSDFAVGQDTMFYSFVAKQGAYVDSVTAVAIAGAPSFFAKKTGELSLADSTKSGIDILTDTAVVHSDPNAILSVSGASLNIKAGSSWAVGGKSISFVPSTQAIYDANNSQDAIDAFEAGTPVAEADPAIGDGVYIFKLTNGATPDDVFYGTLKVLSIVPGVSVSFEYRIGNLYAHLTVLN